MPFSGIVTGSEYMDVTNGNIGNTVSGNLAVSGTLTVTGATTLASATALTAPVITTGLTASGSAANDFSGSTGTFLTSTGVGCAIPASKGVVAYCSATNTWTVFDMPAHAGAAA